MYVFPRMRRGEDQPLERFARRRPVPALLLVLANCAMAVVPAGLGKQPGVPGALGHPCASHGTPSQVTPAHAQQSGCWCVKKWERWEKWEKLNKWSTCKRTGEGQLEK